MTISRRSVIQRSNYLAVNRKKRKMPATVGA